MIRNPRIGLTRPRAVMGRFIAGFLLAGQLMLTVAGATLPKRLVLLLDGVAYRDMKALQAGVVYDGPEGHHTCRAFYHGYFPVSRLVSTFPSSSDVAWTEILGNRPLPGYQRTYFSSALGAMVFQNGVTTSMEYERQMDWQMESGIVRSIGYIHPQAIFKHEVRELVQHFLESNSGRDNYYAMIRGTDDMQHTSGDIFAMLCFLDEELRKLSEQYRAREGRNLEILILSDHGNNHAGAGERVPIQSFLSRAGYRVTDAISGPQDVALPTVGIQNWVELHCAPSETEKLVERLPDLAGVDVITSRNPRQSRQFIVVNAKRERALIDWDPAHDAFRYSVERGDPIGYLPIVAALAKKKQLHADGFASADAWMAATLTHRYPLALERIVRGQTRIALNPASILIGLSNGWVHSSWMLKQMSSLKPLGGTHGALDDHCSNGILLSNFAPTSDTSTRQVAARFDNFPGLRDCRATGAGAEWTYRDVLAMTRVARCPLDRSYADLPDDAPLLRIWTPDFAGLDRKTPVEITVRYARRTSPVRLKRGDPETIDASKQLITLNAPLSVPNQPGCERIYQLPDSLPLEPGKSYQLSWRIREANRTTARLDFVFQTDYQGRPVMR